MKYIIDTWRTLSRSIYTGRRLKANLMALTGVSIATAVLGLILMIIDIVQNDLAMLIPAVITFLGGTGCGIFAGVLKKREIAAIFPTVFCAAMFTVYLFTGMGYGTAPLWSLMMPIGMCYFVSVRFGILLSLYHTVLYSVAFYTPLKDYFVKYYTPAFMLRFPLLFAGVSVFTVIAMVQYHKSALIEIDYAEQLKSEVERQTKAAKERAEKLEELSDEIVEALARAIDAKDKYTNGHSFRVMEYSVKLAERLGWDDAHLKELRREALLHDIGKIGVPDSVLNKPDKLTADEFEIIKGHTTTGKEILSHMKDMEGVALVAAHHHERYDGKGYPSHLAGKNIPEHARIVSIADAYDAMSSNRIYRKALTEEKILSELENGKGTQFDPDFLEVFIGTLAK